MNFRSTALSALVLAATLAGCGHNVAGVATSARAITSNNTTVMAAGVARKLGYDVTRFETKGARGGSHAKHLTRQGLLPASVDNRNFCSPVADQGQLGSCTAFSMGKGLREYLVNKNGERQAPLSPLWLYYEERVLNYSTDYDSGATMDEGMQVLSEQGCATENTWAYDIKKFDVKPPQAAYDSAAEFKIHDSTELATLDDVKTALANGQPVVFGFRVYESFRKVGADGMMPVPKPGEKLLGGHAIMAVGYDDAKKVLIIRNSWSDKWGDKGYFYMPYEVAGSAQAHQFFTATH